MAVEKIWKLRGGVDADNVRQLSSELGVDPVLAELLVQRGVHTFEQARSFFRPSLEYLHDPFLMTDMDKAVERVHDAIVLGEKILVYGDYDVDGTTAVSLVYSFLCRLTKQVDFYIPERYDEVRFFNLSVLISVAYNGSRYDEPSFSSYKASLRICLLIS